jgi:alkanesulfonate monooxygenase SsuD/methylene tetrahydromethanopterin reductase-like flavin-dependent oxidoreductase (luciferase family)
MGPTTVMLSEIAARTNDLRVGTGVLSVWGRSAGTIAMAASTLHAVSEGRFILGLGSSTKQLAEGLHDVVYRAPYSKLRSTISQVRALVRGERTPLAVATEARPLRIAGELCDGWIPFLYPRDRLVDGISLMSEGADSAGVSEKDWQIYPIIPTIVGESTTKAREGAEWVIVFYLKLMGPIYRNVLIRYGYKTEVERVMEANDYGGQRGA